MITVDTLLIELFQQGIDKLDSQIPNRDKRILTSLARQLNSGNFLTENQAKLLIKMKLNFFCRVLWLRNRQDRRKQARGRDFFL